MKQLFKVRGEGSTGLFMQEIEGNLRLMVQNTTTQAMVLLTPDEARDIGNQLRDMANAIKGRAPKAMDDASKQFADDSSPHSMFDWFKGA